MQALTTGNYQGQALPITGPDAVTFKEVTEKIEAAIGKSVAFQPISDEESRRRYSAVSGSVEETEAHVALWRAIREGRLAAVTNHVQQVLGRAPIGLNQWISENIAAFLEAATLTAKHPPGQP